MYKLLGCGPFLSYSSKRFCGCIHNWLSNVYAIRSIREENKHRKVLRTHTIYNEFLSFISIVHSRAILLLGCYQIDMYLSFFFCFIFGNMIWN